MICEECGQLLIGDEASYLEYDGLCAECAGSAAEDEPEAEIPDLGPCCACGEEGSSAAVRNIVMLEQKAPVAGTGWMCLVCGLPPDGAVAVVCDQCLALQEHGRRPIRFAVSGYPASGERVPVEYLAGEHAHDLSRHPEHEGSPA